MSELRFKNNAIGFSLVEVLVVVVIIGILVAIAVPIYNKTITKSDQAVHDANVRTLYSLAQLYMFKEWDDTEKTARDPETMKDLLANYISGGAYPENPTDSGPYEVEISAEGKITVRPGIGQYAPPPTEP